MVASVSPCFVSSAPGCPEHLTKSASNRSTHLLPIGHQLVHQLAGGADGQDLREGATRRRDIHVSIALAGILQVSIALYGLCCAGSCAIGRRQVQRVSGAWMGALTTPVRWKSSRLRRSPASGKSRCKCG